MTRRTTVLIAILGLSAVVLFLVVSRQPREPAYRGMPLSYWMARLIDRPDTPARLDRSYTDARTAIKAIGTNALPYLLEALRREDWPMRKYVVAWVSEHKWLKSKVKLPPSADEIRGRALDAITWLGPAAKPALPDILPLVTNQNYQVKINALFAIRSIGPDAQLVRPVVPGMMQSLGDTNWTMRLAAVNALAALRPPPPEAVPALVRLLNDSNENVREEAMHSLVAQTNTSVLPMLDKWLRDKDSYVVTEAATQIGVFGTNAAASEPRLRELLDAPSMTVRQAATNALAAITGRSASGSAPEEKADITFNFQGMPLQAILSYYEDLAGKKVAMTATLNLFAMLRVQTVRPLTKSQALQCLEEALKDQAGLVIVHRADGSLSAVAKPQVGGE